MQTIDANVSTFAKTLQESGEWLKDMQEIGRFDDLEQSYSALNAAMLALRDRLTPDEAADLAAQLPLLLKGVFYNQWKPADAPQKWRDAQEFLGAVGKRLTATQDPEPERACRALFELLNKRLTPGAVDHARDMLHADVRTLWPEPN